MKKGLLLAAASSLILMTGCEELQNLCGISQDDLSFTEDYTHHLNAAIYVYQQTDRALRDANLEATGSGVIDNANCTRTADSLIVDFGNGTVGSDGVIRKGSYRVGLIGDYNTPGSKANLLLEEYYSGDDLYVGNFALENITPSGTTQPKYSIGVSQFALDVLELNGDLSAQWLVGYNTPSSTDDDFQLSGAAVLANTSNLDAYNGTISMPVLISTACEYSMVSGVIDLIPTNTALPTVELDFLDGDCANMFKATIDCEGNAFSFNLPIK